MRVRKPKLRFIGNDWDERNHRYQLIQGDQVIQTYLNGKVPTFFSRWSRKNERIYLSQVVPTAGPYPDNVNPYSRRGYWRDKTPQNLTDEDKAFLRWVIRKGRLPDSPTKDPGL